MAQYEISKSNEEEEALLLLEEHSSLKGAISSLKKRKDFEKGHFIIEEVTLKPNDTKVDRYDLRKQILFQKYNLKYNLVASSHLGKIKKY